MEPSVIGVSGNTAKSETPSDLCRLQSFLVEGIHCCLGIKTGICFTAQAIQYQVFTALVT